MDNHTESRDTHYHTNPKTNGNHKFDERVCLLLAFLNLRFHHATHYTGSIVGVKCYFYRVAEPQIKSP